jgi:hypothetical protein
MMEHEDDAEADEVENDVDEQDDEHEGPEEVEPSTAPALQRRIRTLGSSPGWDPCRNCPWRCEKDASNSNKAIADTQFTTVTNPTAVEKVAATAPILPKLNFSGGQFLAPEFHEALHHDANNATADNEITNNTTDDKITDSKTDDTELGENKPEVKLEPDGTRGSGESSPEVKTETKEPK